MIAKERSPQEHPETDKFSRAGAEAEERMAFYLRRAFADCRDVIVFHDLRLVDDQGEVAQIDHLILHRRGLILIESKSAVGTLVINEHGEWHRIWDGRKQGMPSPIQQARLQGKLLVALLHGHREELRRKVLFGRLQYGFGACPVDVLVAVGDRGTIERHTEVPEVHKADTIVDGVDAIIRRHKKGAWTLSLKDGIEQFTDEEMERLGFFLLSRHTPRAPVPPGPPVMPRSRTVPPPPVARPASPPPPPPPHPAAAAARVPAPPNQCKHCGSPRVDVAYGRYGYYLKCSACGRNTPIDYTCPQCRKKTAKIRKEGQRFYRECQVCGHSELFHQNA